MSGIHYAGLSMLLLLIGGVLANLLIRPQRQKFLFDLLSFSGAYLFGLLVLEFLPAIFKGGQYLSGIYFLVGFFVQLGMDFWTRGIEHGHLHIQTLHHKPVIVSLFIGLGLHALMDGLPFVGIQADLLVHSHSIFSGILLHKVVEGFTVLLVLEMMGVSMHRAWIYIICFSLITPISILGIPFIPFFIDHIPLVLGFAGGSLLHVAITILFESENQHHHGIPVRKFIFIALGMALAILISLI